MDETRVAIIGAGVAGLASIKSCLEEGLQPICFERHDDIGGCWYYTDALREGQGAAAYRSVVTNNSREMLCFSDYPYPKEWTQFLTHWKVHQYLHSYADHFDLKKHIRLNTNVLKIEQSDDGSWRVITKSDGKEIEEIFTYVMVCSGVFEKATTPSFPGLEEFEGIKMHANEYREPSSFKGKRVVVVGGAYSAGEISCELARSDTADVFLSLRQGTWVIARLGDDGVPWDMALTRSVMLGSVNTIEKMALLSTKRRVGDHRQFGLQNHQSIMATQSIMINDDIQDRITQGQLEPVVEIERFDKDSVTLKDGRILENIDAVIFATGYRIELAFLEDNWITDGSQELRLYRYVFPIGLAEPESMALIGVISQLAPMWQFIELQARWAARVFSKNVKLPTKKEKSTD